MDDRIRVGCAGWALRKESQPLFPSTGTHLERYAQRLPAVEVNSCFYRSHRATTWARWAASTPAGFRFSCKIPKEITHHLRLRHATEPLEQFLNEVSHLGDRVGPLLIQLPPSLPFRTDLVRGFLQELRERYRGQAACEPRHDSWFTAEVDALLREFRIAGVAADPPRSPLGLSPFGDRVLQYFRLHGSPTIYRSPYSPEYLRKLASRLMEASKPDRQVWCIFDNTADGHALFNALSMLDLLGQG